MTVELNELFEFELPESITVKTGIHAEGAEMEEKGKVHPFEAAGLGIAPFRFIGFERKVGPINLGNGMMCGAPGQPMGVCDFCGTGIANCCIIKSSDGKRFIVGCDCVERTYQEFDAERDEVAIKAREELKKQKREARHAREAEKLEELAAWIEENKAVLDAMESDREGQSLYDQWQWFSKNAGTTGKLKQGRIMRKAVEERGAEVQAVLDAGGKTEVQETRARLAAEAEAARIEECERQEAIRKQAKEQNAKLIEVLKQEYQSDFIGSMLNQVRRFPLSSENFSDKVLNILVDIYGKAHGRRNSKKYEAACEELLEIIHSNDEE